MDMLIYYILNLLTNMSRKDNTFGTVAHRISRNISQINDYSLDSLAQLCNSSPSSISRFARIVDYPNYSSMATAIASSSVDYRHGDGQIMQEKNSDQYFQQLAEINQKAEEILLQFNMKGLIDEIKNSKKVIIIGSPLPDATISLQMELHMQQIECTNYYDPQDQEIEVMDSDDDTFIIAYDCYTHDSILPDIYKYKHKQKSLLISCGLHSDLIYQPDYYISFRHMNFAMNIYLANIITYAIVANLQNDC